MLIKYVTDIFSPDLYQIYKGDKSMKSDENLMWASVSPEINMMHQKKKKTLYHSWHKALYSDLRKQSSLKLLI